MALTKGQVTKDGTVIPSPQSPQPPSPSQFTAAAIALHSTAARVAAAATSVLTSPSKTTDITANATDDNAFLGDPTLEEIDYEEEEDKDKDSESSPNEDFYKSNLFDSNDDNVSLGLSEYRVPSARGVGSGR